MTIKFWKLTLPSRVTFSGGFCPLTHFLLADSRVFKLGTILLTVLSHTELHLYNVTDEKTTQSEGIKKIGFKPIFRSRRKWNC